MCVFFTLHFMWRFLECITEAVWCTAVSCGKFFQASCRIGHNSPFDSGCFLFSSLSKRSHTASIMLTSGLRGGRSNVLRVPSGDSASKWDSDLLVFAVCVRVCVRICVSLCLKGAFEVCAFVRVFVRARSRVWRVRLCVWHRFARLKPSPHRLASLPKDTQCFITGA